MKPPTTFKERVYAFYYFTLLRWLYPCRCTGAYSHRYQSYQYTRCWYHKAKDCLRYAMWLWPRYILNQTFRNNRHEDQQFVGTAARFLSRKRGNDK